MYVYGRAEGKLLYYTVLDNGAVLLVLGSAHNVKEALQWRLYYH